MHRIAEFRKKHHDVVGDLMPAMLEKQCCQFPSVNVLVNRDQDGRRVLISKVGEAWNTAEVSNVHVFQLFYLIHQAALMEPATQVHGVVVILDFEGLGMKQVKELTPTFSLRLLSFIQVCMKTTANASGGKGGLQNPDVKVLFCLFCPESPKKICKTSENYDQFIKLTVKIIQKSFQT